MPIRLDLLAEEHAAEELRRRDPVKRVIWGALLVVAVMLAWSSSLQLKTILANSSLTQVQSQLAAHTNTFEQVLTNQKKLADYKTRLLALYQLSTNRFLNGTLLNALQKTTVPQAQLLRLHVDNRCDLFPAVPASTDDNGQTIPAKPARSVEKTTLTLEARDTSPTADAMNQLKRAVAENDYFKARLFGTNQVRLANYSTPQTSPDGHSFVLFTLESRFPDKTR